MTNKKSFDLNTSSEQAILQAAAILKEIAAEIVNDEYTRPLQEIYITISMGRYNDNPVLSIEKSYGLNINKEDGESLMYSQNLK